MTSPSQRPLQVAVIGCGAIAESFYLPALERLGREVRGLVLVDRDPERLEALGERLDGARTATDYRQALPEVDAAILATPPDSHFPIGRACLEAGVHLLCEKPLSATAAEARELVAAAAEAGLVLGVNNTRRLFPSSAHVRRQIESGALGRLRSIAYLEGQPFEWPTTSGFYFASGKAPRGVLMDRGAHVLDLLCWWLGARPRIVASFHDSFGGPEAVAHLELEHGGCRIDVRLSWLYKQRNRFAVVGEEGRVEGDIYDWRAVRQAGGGRERTRRFRSQAGVFNDFAHVLVRNFVAAVAGREEILVPGEAVLDSIALIEDGYRSAAGWWRSWSWAARRGSARPCAAGRAPRASPDFPSSPCSAT